MTSVKRIDDPELVAREYATLDRLTLRRLDRTGWVRGGEPIDTMLRAVAEVHPRSRRAPVRVSASNRCGTIT